MKKTSILVLGGKGKTGRRVAEKLTGLGQNVRIGSRTETPALDWDNPQTWPGALAGMDAVYITFQPDLAVPGALATIIAFTKQAADSGIRKLVLLSGRGEQEAQDCEQVVINSGLPWTIVRASWFNQNFSENFLIDPIMAGVVSLPVTDVREPFIDADDIAAVAVAALLDDKHSGQIYEVTGPHLLTFAEAIRQISLASGKKIEFKSVSMEEYESILKENQVPEDYVWLLKYLFTEVLDGRNASITHDVEKVLSRKPKDFKTYASETSKTRTWAEQEISTNKV